MKICQQCNKKLSNDNFSKGAKSKKGLYSYCKSCAKIKDRKRQEILTTFLDDYKHNIGCYFCSENEPCVLDFHHMNPSEKDFCISSGRRSMANVKKEMKKCIVVCSNCHRKIHAGIIQISQ